MIIACLGKAPSDHLIKHEFKTFPTLVALLKSKEKWDAILLAHSDFPQNGLALRAIRQHEALCLLPVFTLLQITLTPLCDGYYESEAFVSEKTQHISKRLTEIKVRPLDAKSRFLAYCYSRAPFNLLPQADWTSQTYYHYPVAELFIEDASHVPTWLSELAEKDLLTRGELIHSQFICTYCESGHLSFTERCPHCHHENIGQSPFLHCFTCGLIAPEAEFVHEGRFKCPKCESLLRHVGEDYDRPLESGQCFHCHEYYQEPELWVQCMLCEKDYAPERLGKGNSHLYQVSEPNASNILNTYFMQNLSVFDDIHYIEPPFFMALLDWLFVLNQRYPEETFSIIGLKLSLSPIAIPFLHPFAEQLKDILRKTDLLTRMMEDEIWLLLPKTNEAGLNTVLSRITDAKSHLPAELNWQTANICSTKIAKDANMEKILLELRATWS